MADPTPGDTGMPRWVRLTLLTAAVLAVLVIGILLLTDGHGPSRHLS
ncbi:hypothetical protein [Actinokineospora sp.]